MPRWICEHCNAEMTVRADLLGTRRKCRACGKESEVIDADVIRLDPQPEYVAPLPAVESVSRVAKLALLVPCAICLLAGVIVLAAGSELGGIAVVYAIGIAMLTAVLWPIYTMADDTRANRKLLEEIASRKN